MMHPDNISLTLDYRDLEEDLVDLQRCDLEDIPRSDESSRGRILAKVATVYLSALLVAMVLGRILTKVAAVYLGALLVAMVLL